jgi:hypothetical protein
VIALPRRFEQHDGAPQLLAEWRWYPRARLITVGLA